jgi:hypothetical protein
MGILKLFLITLGVKFTKGLTHSVVLLLSAGTEVVRVVFLKL